MPVLHTCTLPELWTEFNNLASQAVHVCFHYSATNSFELLNPTHFFLMHVFFKVPVKNVKCNEGRSSQPYKNIHLLNLHVYCQQMQTQKHWFNIYKNIMWKTSWVFWNSPFLFHRLKPTVIQLLKDLPESYNLWLFRTCKWSKKLFSSKSWKASQCTEDLWVSFIPSMSVWLLHRAKFWVFKTNISIFQLMRGSHQCIVLYLPTFAEITLIILTTKNIP